MTVQGLWERWEAWVCETMVVGCWVRAGKWSILDEGREERDHVYSVWSDSVGGTMLEEKRALMSPVFVYRKSVLFGGKRHYYDADICRSLGYSNGFHRFARDIREKA